MMLLSIYLSLFLSLVRRAYFVVAPSHRRYVSVACSFVKILLIERSTSALFALWFFPWNIISGGIYVTHIWLDSYFFLLFFFLFATYARDSKSARFARNRLLWNESHKWLLYETPRDKMFGYFRVELLPQFCDKSSWMCKARNRWERNGRTWPNISRRRTAASHTHFTLF